MRLVLAVPVVVACALGLGGCRGGDRVALPVATPAVAPPSASAPAVSTRSGAVRSGSAATGAAADPLAGIESEVDAVERDLDADADSGPAPRR
jgi:hypothetical protein